MQVALSYETLGELDGGAARAIIDAAIADAVRDVDDRGEDEKPRKVTVELEIRRLDNGCLSCTVNAIAKLPTRRTASTIAQVGRKQGKACAVFQVYAPEDPSQRTIDEAEERNKQEGK